MRLSRLSIAVLALCTLADSAQAHGSYDPPDQSYDRYEHREVYDQRGERRCHCRDDVSYREDRGYGEGIVLNGRLNGGDFDGGVGYGSDGGGDYGGGSYAMSSSSSSASASAFASARASAFSRSFGGGHHGGGHHGGGMHGGGMHGGYGGH